MFVSASGTASQQRGRVLRALLGAAMTRGVFDLTDNILYIEEHPEAQIFGFMIQGRTYAFKSYWERATLY